MYQGIDGGVFFSDQPSVLRSADMVNTKPESSLGRCVDFIDSCGFNAVGVYQDVDRHRRALAGLAQYLKGRGIRLLVGHAWSEVEAGGHVWRFRNVGLERTSELFCPFNAQVRRYWQERVERDFAAVPDLGGYWFIATEYYWVNGAPWMCDCSQCQSLTRQERLLVAIEHLAGLLEPYGARLFWKSHQDDPWGVATECELFSGLTGRLPDNALVHFSDHYWDLEPGWPRHPLYDQIRPTRSGDAPYLVRIQLSGEYRGMHLFPCPMVGYWEGTFDRIRRLGLAGFSAQAFVGANEWDHPLNLVNWYATGRYASDPDATPDAIMAEWAAQVYGSEAAPSVVEMLRLSYAAAPKLFFFEGLWTCNNHSQFAGLLYLDSHMCGPYRQSPAVEGCMGLEFPLDMYPPERAAEIKADPSARLLFNREPITRALKARAMEGKAEAIRLIEDVIALWEGTEGAVDHAVHTNLKARLRANRVDALVFRTGLDLYFDWKLGCLTEARIDEVIESFRGLKGAIVLDPVGQLPKSRRSSEDAPPSNLRSLGEELRRDLRERWVAQYFDAHPLGVGVESSDQ
jgi:hypothetical protein